MIIFYSVIVVYNKEIINSKTCNNLKLIKGHDIRTIIVDNSTQKNKNKEVCEKNQWMYISMNGNAGLSKAYNKALDWLKEKDGVVIWFDDDSNVTQEYFDVLETTVNKELECDIFAPVICGQDGKFWSPNEYRFFRNKQLKQFDQNIDEKKFNAINSCTAVRLKTYENYRYDEKLFLDQVDHKFFSDQRKRGVRFKKLDVIINHNFSTKSRMSSYDALKIRYKIMIRDFIIFCNDSKPHLVLGWIKIAGWGIKEGIKYHKIDFFFWCLAQATKAQREI